MSSSEAAQHAALRAAAADLALLDTTFENRCAFRAINNTAHRLEQPHQSNDCAAAIQFARRLPRRWGVTTWDGMMEGCPHVAPTKRGHPQIFSRPVGDCYAGGDAPWPPVRELPGNSVLKLPGIHTLPKSVLIVLFGLQRYYHSGWAKLQQTLIRSNPDVSF